MFNFPQPQKPLDIQDFSKMSFHFLEENIDIEDEYDQSKAPEEELHDFEVDHGALHLLREIWDHIDDKGREILAKMFSKTETEASSHEVFIQKLEGLAGRHIADVFRKLLHEKVNGNVQNRADEIMQRSVGSHRKPTGELKRKLERFKVKTVNFGLEKDEEEKGKAIGST